MNDENKMIERIVVALRLLAELPYSGVHVIAQRIIEEKVTAARLATAARESAREANEKTAEAHRAHQENKTLRQHIIKLSGELARAKNLLEATVPFMTPRAPPQVPLPTAPAVTPKTGGNKRGRPKKQKEARRGCFGGNLEKADTICELCADIDECKAKQQKNMEKKKRERAR